MKRAAVVLLAVAALCLLPFAVPAGWVAVLAKMLIAALFALAFNVLAGQAGMLSFGHAAYFAAGSFATLHLMRAVEHGMPFPTPLLPLAGALAGLLVGAVAGLFATVRSGVYFSMITLAIAEFCYSLAPSMEGLFGGEGGISSMRMPWAGIGFGTDTEVYYVVLGWSLLATALLYGFTLTPLGRLTVALRENEQRVRFLGFDTYRTKIIIFAVSAMGAGLAGGLLAVANESASYVLFETGQSANVVLNTFIGGAGVFFGPALGAVLMTGFSYAMSDRTALLLFYQGAIFILVMLFVPGGLGGVLARHAEPWRAGWWPRLIGPYALAVLPVLALALAVVFVAELLQRLYALDYLNRVRLAGHSMPVSFAGRDWMPDAVTTWALPALLAVFGVLLLRPATRRVRAAWQGTDA